MMNDSNSCFTIFIKYLLHKETILNVSANYEMDLSKAIINVSLLNTKEYFYDNSKLCGIRKIFLIS